MNQDTLIRQDILTAEKSPPRRPVLLFFFFLELQGPRPTELTLHCGGTSLELSAEKTWVPGSGGGCCWPQTKEAPPIWEPTRWEDMGEAEMLRGTGRRSERGEGALPQGLSEEHMLWNLPVNPAQSQLSVSFCPLVT